MSDLDERDYDSMDLRSGGRDIPASIMADVVGQLPDADKGRIARKLNQAKHVNGNPQLGVDLGPLNRKPPAWPSAKFNRAGLQPGDRTLLNSVFDKHDKQQSSAKQKWNKYLDSAKAQSAQESEAEGTNQATVQTSRLCAIPKPGQANGSVGHQPHP